MMNRDVFMGICEESSLGIILLDQMDTHCAYINSAAKKILDIEENVKLPSLDFIFSTTSEDELAGQRVLSRKLLSIDLVDDVIMQRQDGSDFVSRLEVKAVCFELQKFYLLSFRDVTSELKMHRDLMVKQDELKATYESLLAQNQALSELDKMKDRFIALVSHELRTPLSAIIATADVLNQGLYDSSDELMSFLKSILEEGNHLMDIVNDVLDFSKIQSGKMEYFVGQEDIKLIVSKYCKIFNEMAKLKEVRLVNTISLEKILCYFDPLCMSQVVSNVINNAIKFNRIGGSVTFQISESSDFVVLIVTDEGPGIPKEKFNKVFNEFETIENISTHHKGTGLGMPISKKLMEAIGGSLSFESEINRGTSFYISIPKNKILSEDLYKTRIDINIL